MLPQEAPPLTPIQSDELKIKFILIKSLYDQNLIDDYRLIAGYIVIYIQVLYPDCWLLTQKNKTIVAQPHVERFSQLIQNYIERPQLYNNLIDDEKLLVDLIGFENKCKICTLIPHQTSLSIFTLFEYKLLYKVELSICQLIIDIFTYKVPVKIYFDIPEPEEVLQLQRVGMRCISLLIDEASLNAWWEEDYPPFDKKDSLDFVKHDLKHLSKLLDCETFFCQVGFFNWVYSHLPLLSELCSKECHLKPDLDHCISDMNCSSAQLIGFLKAKLIASTHRYFYPPPSSQLRLNQEQHNAFEAELWSKLINGVDQDVRKLLEDLCHKKLNSHEKEKIHRWFERFGQSIFIK